MRWAAKGVPMVPTKAAQMPHRTRMRINTQRAPQWTTLTVLGISRIQYPQKKMPKPKPRMARSNPRPPSLGDRPMPSPATATLTRSRYAKMYRKKRKGISRQKTRQRVRWPIVLSKDAGKFCPSGGPLVERFAWSFIMMQDALQGGRLLFLSSIATGPPL